MRPRMLFLLPLISLAAFITAPAQWSDFSTKTASKNLYGAMNSKPAIRSAGSGAPAVGCTAGKDLYIDTASPGRFYFCPTTDTWKLAATEMIGVTAQITGEALDPGECITGFATVTGALTNMPVVATPTTYPGDEFVWKAYVSSSNTVAVKVCAIVAGTPQNSFYQVRVLP